MIYTTGDAVQMFKEAEGPAVLVHQVNCQGVMGSGIAKQIRKEFPEHYKDYREFYEMGLAKLGSAVTTQVEEEPFKLIIGLFGQEYYGFAPKRYTNYAALISALTISDRFPEIAKDCEIFIPRLIGCDRGGGDWDIVSKLLIDFEQMSGVEFTCVEYPRGG